MGPPKGLRFRWGTWCFWSKAPLLWMVQSLEFYSHMHMLHCYAFLFLHSLRQSNVSH